MKIGLSYSRCVKDIVEGRIDIADVLVVIARTDFDPRDDEQWQGIWKGYGGGQIFGSPFSNPEWMDHPAEDEDRFRSVSIELWETGKLHQPRKFGAHPSRLPHYWLEASLPADELESNPAVKKAWEQFQIIAGLSKSTKILKDKF
jgi:hypothetical protein